MNQPSWAAFEGLAPTAEDVFFHSLATDSVGRFWSHFSYRQRFGLPELSINRGASGIANRRWGGEVGWSTCGDDLYRESRLETSGSYRTAAVRLSFSLSLNSLTIKGCGSEIMPGSGFSAEISTAPVTALIGGDGLLPLSDAARRAAPDPMWWSLLSLSPLEGWRIMGWWWTTGWQSPSLHLGFLGRVTGQASAGLALGDKPERILGVASFGWRHLRAGYNAVWQPRLGLSQELSLGFVF